MAIDKKEYYQRQDIASHYERVRFGSEAGQMAHGRELAVLRATFRPGEKLLELACGTGRLLRELRKEGWNVTGVDQSSAMLEQLPLTERSFVYQADVTQLPFPSESFDGVYSFRFTNHTANIFPFFKECYRVLRPGGHAVFDTMRWSPLMMDWNHFGGRNFILSDGQTRKKLGDAGFRIEKTHPLFLLSPFLLSRFPAILTHGILKAQKWLPESWYAITLWHVYKIS